MPTLSIAETLERLHTLHAEVLTSAARHEQAPQGAWQQKNLESIAWQLHTIIALYEED